MSRLDRYKEQQVMISLHAYQRAKERLGLDKEALNRLVPKVVDKGVKMKDVKGKVKKYLTDIFEKEGKYGSPVIYGQNVYIFNSGQLITMWNIPKDVKNYKPYIKKTE